MNDTTNKVRSYSRADLPLERLATRDQTITVFVPAHDEAETIGHIAETLVGLQRRNLIDEVIVAADRCTDRTVEIATEAGARVLDTRDLFPELGEPVGKGDVLWRGLPSCKGDLVLWVDGDTGTEFGEHYVAGLAVPLLDDPAVQLAKGIYRRPFALGAGVSAEQANLREGRVSFNVAKPALRRFFPKLGALEQPLSGEMGIRRELAMQLPFPADYGIEVGLLIEVLRQFGLPGLAEADLTLRVNRHQDTVGLLKMAYQVHDTIVSYAIGEVGAGRTVRPPHLSE